MNKIAYHLGYMDKEAAKIILDASLSEKTAADKKVDLSWMNDLKMSRPQANSLTGSVNWTTKPGSGAYMANILDWFRTHLPAFANYFGG